MGVTRLAVTVGRIGKPRLAALRLLPTLDSLRPSSGIVPGARGGGVEGGVKGGVDRGDVAARVGTNVVAGWQRVVGGAGGGECG